MLCRAFPGDRTDRQYLCGRAAGIVFIRNRRNRKTELAKRYAYENESRYKKIVFVPFTDSIEKTVCGDDLRIHQMEQNEGEPDGDYFKRKLKLLKDVTSPDDLVILDNFDVEADDCLEALFACPCRFSCYDEERLSGL